MTMIAAEERCPDGCDTGPPSGLRLRGLFESFVRAQMKRTLRRLVRIGISRADAEDFLQVGFLKLWERRHRVPPGAWPGWLRVVLGNDALHAQRTYARAASNEAALTYQMRLDHQAEELEPEAVLGAMQVDVELARLVEALPPARAAVARLCFLEELPFADAAARLGLPAGTVKALWRLARRDLRAAVKRRRARERVRAGGFVSFGFFLWLWRERWARQEALVRPAVGLSLVVAMAAALVVTHAPSRPHRTGEEAAALSSVTGVVPATAAGWAAVPGASTALATRPAPSAARGGDAPAPMSREARAPLAPASTSRAAHGAPSRAASRKSEGELLRLAAQSVELHPARALAWLREHASRFPDANVTVRTELVRRAAEAKKREDAGAPRP